jgi:hypothetical protein
MAKIASHRFQGIAGRSNIERPTSNVEWEKMKVKILAQRTWLWFAPWKGALHDPALLNILMEYWSNGVLEKRKPNTDLLQP